MTNHADLISALRIPMNVTLRNGAPELDEYDEQRKAAADRIEELEAKLAKAVRVQEAQKLLNYYACEVVAYGATVPRLQNLENAWLNLKTQSELAEINGGGDT